MSLEVNHSSCDCLLDLACVPCELTLMDELLCAQYYAEKVAESAQTLGPSGLGGQLMQLHASGDVLGKTETRLVIAGGGSDVASTLLGNAGVVNMDGRK